MIPYRNATLTKITAVGSSDDYDDPAVAGADRWTGSEGIYVDDTRGQILAPGRIDEIEQTRVEIPYAIGKLVQRGDTLTFTFNGTSQTGIAADLSGDPLVGRRRVLLEDR
jgi:hypothetical protein